MFSPLNTSLSRFALGARLPERAAFAYSRSRDQRSIHLVGGVPLDASDVFDLAGGAFGTLAKRLPDGEKKRGWLRRKRRSSAPPKA